MQSIIYWFLATFQRLLYEIVCEEKFSVSEIHLVTEVSNFNPKDSFAAQ